MIGHTHHTAIKQHSSTIAEFDIHRKPKIRKSVFSSWSRNFLFFCRRVRVYFLLFNVFGCYRDALRDEKNCDYSKIGRKECDYILWKNGMLEVRVKKVLKKKA